MAAYKNLRRIFFDFLSSSTVVFWGVTSDMGYPNIDLFAKKSIVQRKFLLNNVIIDISIAYFKILSSICPWVSESSKILVINEYVFVISAKAGIVFSVILANCSV